MILILTFCAIQLGYRLAKPHWFATPFWAIARVVVMVHC